MTRREPPPGKRRRQIAGQADPVRQQPHREQSCVRDHAGPVSGDC
jgi:hypothetical protein